MQLHDPTNLEHQILCSRETNSGVPMIDRKQKNELMLYGSVHEVQVDLIILDICGAITSELLQRPHAEAEHR